MWCDCLLDLGTDFLVGNKRPPFLPSRVRTVYDFYLYCHDHAHNDLSHFSVYFKEKTVHTFLALAVHFRVGGVFSNACRFKRHLSAR